MVYILGTRSVSLLQGVHPNLALLAREAILISKQDFGVFEGVRSLEKEQDNINKGVSKLSDPRHCKHCIQQDNFGHAVDLVPFVDGEFKWDWDYIWPIVTAMREAALKHNIMITWGGVWDRRLNALSPRIQDEVELYKRRHQGSDFLDGPHYELP